MVFTDVIQAIVMLVGLVVIVVVGAITVGSISSVFDIAHRGGRLEFFKYVFDNNTLCKGFALYTVPMVS